MRPVWAVLMAVATIAAWAGLRSLAGGSGLFVFVLSGTVLVLLTPVVTASCLLGRRWLGRRTSIEFATQAGVLVLAGLLIPDSGDTEPVAPVAVLIGQDHVSPGEKRFLLVIGTALAMVWLVLIPVIAVLAWRAEPPFRQADQ